MDSETGWYNFGARYLNPTTGLWLSAEPALGDYLPNAPLTDDDKKHNQSLPGNGGIYNPVNFALYHFAGNNPIRYTDPDGREITYVPVTLRGAQGTAAHNTAYPYVARAIMDQGYGSVMSNMGMRNPSDTESVISASRPDWQAFGGGAGSVDLWEMKQGDGNAPKAQKDIAGYIKSFASMGITAKPGAALGMIAMKVPVNGMSNTVIDIYSNNSGVVTYQAYRVQGADPILSPATSTQKEKGFEFLGLTGGAAVGVLVVSELSRLIPVRDLVPVP